MHHRSILLLSRAGPSPGPRRRHQEHATPAANSRHQQPRYSTARTARNPEEPTGWCSSRAQLQAQRKQASPLQVLFTAAGQYSRPGGWRYTGLNTGAHASGLEPHPEKKRAPRDVSRGWRAGLDRRSPAILNRQVRSMFGLRRPHIGADNARNNRARRHKALKGAPRGQPSLPPALTAAPGAQRSPATPPARPAHLAAGALTLTSDYRAIRRFIMAAAAQKGADPAASDVSKARPRPLAPPQPAGAARSRPQPPTNAGNGTCCRLAKAR